MSGALKRNLCGLRAPGTITTTISPIQVNKCLTEELRYACRFWIQHLYRGKLVFLMDMNLQDQVFNFLKTSLLYWLESLSLMRCPYEAIRALISLEDLVNEVSLVSKFLFPIIEGLNRGNVDNQLGV